MFAQLGDLASLWGEIAIDHIPTERIVVEELVPRQSVKLPRLEEIIPFDGALLDKIGVGEGLIEKLPFKK